MPQTYTEDQLVEQQPAIGKILNRSQ